MPRKPFTSINPDISEELASFMEDYFVPHLSQAVAKLLKMTASHTRGTVNWLNAVEGVGVLLALATDEDKARVLAQLRTVATAKRLHEAAPLIDSGDIFK